MPFSVVGTAPAQSSESFESSQNAFQWRSRLCPCGPEKLSACHTATRASGLGVAGFQPFAMSTSIARGASAVGTSRSRSSIGRTPTSR